MFLGTFRCVVKFEVVERSPLTSVFFVQTMHSAVTRVPSMDSEVILKYLPSKIAGTWLLLAILTLILFSLAKSDVSD